MRMMDAIIVTGGTVEEIAALVVGPQGQRESDDRNNDKPRYVTVY